MFRSRKVQSAVAISYDVRCDSAPQIALSASGGEAEEIVKIARRFGVPVIEDRTLARALSQLDHGASIPERLFRAVAIILNRIDSILNHSSR